MVANVNAFLGQFNGSGQRLNRYEVFIGFPRLMGVTDNSIKQKISFTCESAAIPGSQLGEAVIHYKGRPVKLPGDRTFDDWTVTISVDTDFKGREIFEQWSSGMLGYSSNLVKNPEALNGINIFGQAQVHMLDRYDRIVARYQLTGIWPKTVGEVQIGYSQNDEIMKQTVTFAVNDIAVYDANNNLRTN